MKLHRKRRALYFKSNIQLLQHQLKMENVPLEHKEHLKIIVFSIAVNRLQLKALVEKGARFFTQN